jgi:hypothetical protein
MAVGLYSCLETAFFLNPNSVSGSEFIEIPGLNAIIRNGMGSADGVPVPPMYIWGYARYEDVFGDRHWVKWCYRARPESHRGERLRVHFIQAGEYNQSGDGDMPEDSRGDPEFIKRAESEFGPDIFGSDP